MTATNSLLLVFHKEVGTGFLVPEISVPHLDALFRPVGELIINWAVLDSQIIKMVAMLYHTEEGNSLVPEPPREFSRRIRFLRRCAGKVPELSSWAENMRGMLTSAKELVVVRDALVHGAVSSYDEQDQRYSFVNLGMNRSDNVHVANTVKMTLDDIEAYLVESQRVTQFAIKLNQHLVTVFA